MLIILARWPSASFPTCLLRPHGSSLKVFWLRYPDASKPMWETSNSSRWCWNGSSPRPRPRPHVSPALLTQRCRRRSTPGFPSSTFRYSNAPSGLFSSKPGIPRERGTSSPRGNMWWYGASGSQTALVSVLLAHQPSAPSLLPCEYLHTSPLASPCSSLHAYPMGSCPCHRTKCPRTPPATKTPRPRIPRRRSRESFVRDRRDRTQGCTDLQIRCAPLHSPTAHAGRTHASVTPHLYPGVTDRSAVETAGLGH